jgi:enamine deaminase RidA (YjgF/YER057c/UK114 family)
MLDTALHDRDRELDAASAEHGFDPAVPLQIGGRYSPLVRDGRTLYLSGQIPRIGDHVAVAGVVGAEVSLERAKRAAAICVLRALTLLRQELGSLNRLQAVVRMTVFVHCDAGFTQHSEVADGASSTVKWPTVPPTWSGACWARPAPTRAPRSACCSCPRTRRSNST